MVWLRALGWPPRLNLLAHPRALPPFAQKHEEKRPAYICVCIYLYIYIFGHRLIDCEATRKQRPVETGLCSQAPPVRTKGVLPVIGVTRDHQRAHPRDVHPPREIKPCKESHRANGIRTALTSMGLASQAHGTHAAVQKRQVAMTGQMMYPRRAARQAKLASHARPMVYVHMRPRRVGKTSTAMDLWESRRMIPGSMMGNPKG